MAADDDKATAAQAKAFSAESQPVLPDSVIATGVPGPRDDDADVFMTYYRQHPGASAHWIGDLLGWTHSKTKKVVASLVEDKLLVHDGNPEFLRVTPKGLKTK